MCFAAGSKMSAVLQQWALMNFILTNIRNKFGTEVVKDLFPDYPFKEDPIIPAGT